MKDGSETKLARKDILKANRDGMDRLGTYWSYYTPVLQVAFDLGQRGVDLSLQPDVTGYRYGKMPESGLSYNYSGQKSERGLSLAAIDGQKETGSCVWFADRDTVKVSGLLLPYKGSDGEPLILPFCVENLD